jgi:hypothetical protein
MSYQVRRTTPQTWGVFGPISVYIGCQLQACVKTWNQVKDLMVANGWTRAYCLLDDKGYNVQVKNGRFYKGTPY